MRSKLIYKNKVFWILLFITLYQIVDTLGISLKEFFDDSLFNDISD